LEGKLLIIAETGISLLIITFAPITAFFPITTFPIILDPENNFTPDLITGYALFFNEFPCDPIVTCWNIVTSSSIKTGPMTIPKACAIRNRFPIFASTEM
jgi:hypothetical protein